MSSTYLQTVRLMASRFDPVSLDEMDTVKLMDRIDMKFILPFEQFTAVMPQLAQHYKVLTLDNNQVFSYKTDYFDTPGLDMFYDHHNERLTRYKVRRREYVESKIGFLEVKYRTNKGRIIKERIKYKGNNDQVFEDFIGKTTPYNPTKLNCNVVNQFNRLTLVDKGMLERVTTDFNISFTDKLKNISLSGLVIIEIKQAHTDKTSLIYQALKKNNIRPCSVSKYCVGVSLLNENLKNNNFKPVLLKINKLSHVEFTA
jgi:hypothetical protein